MSVAQAELIDVELALKRVKADLKSGPGFSFGTRTNLSSWSRSGPVACPASCRHL